MIMKNKKRIGKKAFVSMRAMFLIFNLVVAVVAFSYMIGVVSGTDPIPTTTATTIPRGISSEPEGEEFTTGGDPTNLDDDTSPDHSLDDKDPEEDEGGGLGGGEDVPGGPDTTPGGGTGSLGWKAMIMKGGIGASIFGTIGALAGGDNGALYGSIAGGIGGAVAGIVETMSGSETAGIFVGLTVATIIFLMTYSKKSQQIVEFYCLPWQAPIGGENCQVCNEFEHCSEYMCKSLGQACDIIDAGTPEQKCIWLNPHDVNSPLISLVEVSKEHVFKPDNNIRPPATGVVINKKNGECIRAFFPLEFTIITNEPSQCKIDYNLIAGTKENPRAGFDNMEFYLGGDGLYKYNHTEKLSLPGPDAINSAAPELKNDGDYTLFIRCQDANGNFNQDAYSVSFCVEKGPDTTPPLIVNTNIQSGNPVQFNQTNLDLEVYVNEPAKCKWSGEDRDYDAMESEMSCSVNVWEMNNENVYTCKVKLTGIKDREENKYYFKCKDQPWAEEGDRNENKQSYVYSVIGTQPLNILEIGPDATIKGATDSIPVYLRINTDNGYKDGEALCYYYNDEDNEEPVREEDYVLFHETKSNEHTQRQDLVAGDYVYYFKCLDLGGNAVYDSTSFKVETDRTSPLIVRVYREDGLKIITNEKAECSYSNQDCNFEIESGIEMRSDDKEVHTGEWVLNRNYYIRCKDEYDNQVNPNVCSIIVRPSLSIIEENIDEDEWDFSF